MLQRKPSTGSPPPAPESFDEILAALEQAHREFGDLIRSYSEDELMDMQRG